MEQSNTDRVFYKNRATGYKINHRREKKVNETLVATKDLTLSPLRNKLDLINHFVKGMDRKGQGFA